jgi:hypothetical protein
MAVTGSFPRPLHQAFRVSFVVTVSMSISLSFVLWTVVYGVAGFVTICGRDDATRDPSAAGMVGLLVGFVLIGAALISLAFVWYALGRRCDLRSLVVAYYAFASLWAAAAILLTGVAGKAIMATLMSNASCT